MGADGKDANAGVEPASLKCSGHDGRPSSRHQVRSATRQMAEDYAAVIARRKPNGERKTALVVSPTHKEADQRHVTDAIRDTTLKESEGKLSSARPGVHGAAPAQSDGSRAHGLRQLSPRRDCASFIRTPKGSHAASA